jgi:hypothetical protein
MNVVIFEINYALRITKGIYQGFLTTTMLAQPIKLGAQQFVAPFNVATNLASHL